MRIRFTYTLELVGLNFMYENISLAIKIQLYTKFYDNLIPSCQITRSELMSCLENHSNYCQ